jgi:hypothetical protein
MTTLSPAFSAGVRNGSTYASTTRALTGPSKTSGATTPSNLKAATKVLFSNTREDSRRAAVWSVLIEAPRSDQYRLAGALVNRRASCTIGFHVLAQCRIDAGLIAHLGRPEPSQRVATRLDLDLRHPGYKLGDIKYRAR